MKTKSTRRLRARAAAMNTHEAEYDDYGPEPNMKLSHAFLVVLLLHVIAVGGLYAFNTMKAGRASKGTVAKMAAPSGQPAGPSGNPNDQEQKPENPKNRPPTEEKSVPVAKTSEAPKVVAKTAPKPATQPIQPHKGILASAKTALQRLTGGGLGVAGAASAVAQESNSQPAPGVQAADPAPAASSPSADKPKTYLVKAGDTITKIASSLGVSILDLEKANGLVGNAVLRVGQTLKVPEKVVAQAAADAGNQVAQIAGAAQQVPGSIAAAAASAVGAAPAATNAPPATADMMEYTIVKGDNPYKLAKKFKITPEELMKANNITDPKKIQIGQKLKIPSSAKKSAQKIPSAQ